MIEETSRPDAQTAAIATRLTDARRAAKALTAYPGDVPETLEQGYAIQDAAIALWDDAIIGWKIGLVPPPLRPRLGADRVSGPIFARSLKQANGETVEFPVFSGGFAAVEAEFVFRMGRDAQTGKAEWSEDEAAALVESCHIGVETAGSPMPMINALGPTAVASDFGNNAGLIVGPRVADWRGRLNDLAAMTSIDGKKVGEGKGSGLPGGPMTGLRFLLAHLSKRGRPLKAGQYVSSGALTGVHDIIEGQNALLSFFEQGEIACRAIRARPRV